MGLSTVRLASNHGRADLSMSGLTNLARRFQNSPDVYRIHLLHLVCHIAKTLVLYTKQYAHHYIHVQYDVTYVFTY